MQSSKITALEKEIRVIHTMIQEISAEASNHEIDKDMDFLQIQEQGKRSAFIHHHTDTLDHDLKLKYCAFLAGMVNLSEDWERKRKQYYFVSKILFAQSIDITLEELIRDASLSTMADYQMLENSLTDEGIKLLLFDALLMISLSGDMEEKQRNYFYETIAFFQLSKNLLANLLGLVSCVLTLNEKQLYQYAKGVPVSLLSCYFGKRILFIATAIEEITKVKDLEIIVYGVSFKGMEVRIDDYKKKNIRFLNCIFDNISNMTAYETKVEFENCQFQNCKREYELHTVERVEVGHQGAETVKGISFGLFQFNKGYIKSCKFENCRVINDKIASVILRIDEGFVENCSFNECLVGANSTHCIYQICSVSLDGSIDYAALIHSKKVSIIKCEFVNCYSHGNGYFSDSRSTNSPSHQTVHMIFCKGGSIRQCSFSGCKCKDSVSVKFRYNYLINSNGALEKENTFRNCSSYGNVGFYDWRI